MSIVLEPDEDDGYFTPVASTTLASIFKDDSSNDEAVNPSLKYKPPQLKKTESSKPEADASVSQCEFSCSVLAYEWVQGAHKCKGKVGFAMMKMTVKSGLHKIILYSPDKSTLSCTTVSPQLEVTMSSGSMMSFYDDHKKYWGLSFNENNVRRVTELLRNDNVVIKPYISPKLKPDIESADSDEATDETGNNSTTENDVTTSHNSKASILNRIANVGHAILPSLPGSPVKKITSLETTSTPELGDSKNKPAVISDVTIRKGKDNTTIQDQEFTKNISIPTGIKNVEINNMLPNNKTECAQTSVTSLPLVNNQIFTYVNGYMVPLHMQVPVINNVTGAEACAEIDFVIHKLTHLKNVVRSIETQQLQSIEKPQNELLVKKISDLEDNIREKDETIRHLENAKKDLSDRVNCLNEQLQISMKDLKRNKNVLDKEEHMLLNRKVKTLMNNTFHSLASNFDSDVNYTGNNVKGILAAVIKKITIESLANLFPSDASISTKENN